MSNHSSMAPGAGKALPTLRLGGLELPLQRRDIPIADTLVPLLEVPYTQPNLDAVSAHRGLRERDWPYWLEDWPATYALAEALAGEVDSDLRGPVLDLGCGSGFLAAFFRIRFGRAGLKVFSCDFNRDACRLAALNASLGAVAPAPRVFCADFNHFPSRARFGLLLAGEMLYARENQEPILSFLDLHMAPGGSAWLADPGRSAAEGFRDVAAAAGWRVGVRRVSSPAARRNVDVYRLDRPAAGPGADSAARSAPRSAAEDRGSGRAGTAD